MEKQNLGKLKILLQNTINKKDYLSASYYVQEIIFVLQSDNENGKNAKDIKIYKKELVEYNKLASKDFKTISTKMSIKDEDILKEYDFIFSEKDFEKLMRKIGIKFLLSKEEVKKLESKNYSIWLNFCSTSVIDDDGNLIIGGQNEENLNYFNTYNLSIAVKECLLSIVFQKLLKDETLTLEKLENYFKSHIYIFLNYEMFAKFKIGLKRYFENDYLSSISILVPLLENSITYISKLIGIDFIRLNRGKKKKGVSTGNKALGSEIINLEDFKKIWKEDFAEMLDFVFFKDLGKQIRHKIAHGDMGFYDYNFSLNTLILYFFIYISIRIQINQK